MTPERTRGPLVLPRILIPSVFAVIVLSACDAAAGPVVDTYDVRDSAGVAIVEAGRPTRSWRLSAEPEVRIGVVDGEQPYLFDDVSFAARLEDGRIVVVDEGTLEIRYFEPDGRHRASVGRAGQGPGEFVAFGNVTIGPGDTLWIRDARSPRITVVSPAEEIARVYPVANLDRGTGLRLIGPIGQGRVATTTRPTLGSAGVGPDPTYTRDTLLLTVLTLEDLAAEEIATIPAGEQIQSRTATGDGRVRASTASVPLGHQAHSAALDGAVVFGVSDRAEIRVMEASGRLTHVIRLADREALLLSDVREPFLAFQEANARTAGRPEPEVAELRRRSEATLAQLAGDRLVPGFDAVQTDAAGRIWIRDYRLPWEAAGPSGWSVYERDGRPVAGIELPRELRVMHLGAEHVTGVIRDELDVEYVVVYRIEEVEVP